MNKDRVCGSDDEEDVCVSLVCGDDEDTSGKDLHTCRCVPDKMHIDGLVDFESIDRTDSKS